MTFDRFLRGIAPLCDIAWRKYRRRGPRRAVETRISQLGLAGYEEYLDLLRRDPAEARALPDRMIVTVSRFFREQARWETLERVIIPTILAGKPESEPFRVWSAGCCGGEEPYSLAVMWSERFRSRSPSVLLQILATDIDRDSLSRARSACYRESSLREVPETLRRRWFERRRNLWCLGEESRGQVRFLHHNLLEQPFPGTGAIDLLLCRYFVFTYFRGERLRRAAARLNDALAPSGVLVLGRKEGLGREVRDLFSPWPGVPGAFLRRRPL